MLTADIIISMLIAICSLILCLGVVAAALIAGLANTLFVLIPRKLMRRYARLHKNGCDAGMC